MIPNNARPLRITAAAGTKLAGVSSLATVIILTSERTLQPVKDKASTFCAFLVHAILLDQAFAHCPRFPTAGVKPGPCLSPSVADHPLRSTKDRWLGRPLPHQLPNLPQAHPKTTVCLYVLFDISNSKINFKTKLSQILGQILVYYSPVRHVFTFD